MSEQLKIAKNIKSERLTLRPLNLDDANHIFEYTKSIKGSEFVGYNVHTSIDDTKKLIDRWLKTYENKKGIIYAIETIDTKTVIGTFGLSYNYNHKSVEVSYTLSHHFWRKGYMKEVLNTMINYVFTNLDIIRIEGYSVVENEASAKTMTSCGMIFEGIKHHSYIKNDKIYDCKIFGLTRASYFKQIENQ